MSRVPTTFDEALTTSLSRLGLTIDDSQVHRLQAHFDAMVKVNKVMNLTRITDPVEAAVKHYADSAALIAWARESKVELESVLDIGTGAGFPAFPLAVLLPDCEVTAIDGTRKKVDFLRDATNAIGLGNLSCVHAHSRYWKSERLYQVVTCRAVAKIPEALEQMAPNVAPGGWLVLFKTMSLDQAEQAAANSPAPALRLRSRERYLYELPWGNETLERCLHVFSKDAV